MVDVLQYCGRERVVMASEISLWSRAPLSCEYWIGRTICIYLISSLLSSVTIGLAIMSEWPHERKSVQRKAVKTESD